MKAVHIIFLLIGICISSISYAFDDDWLDKNKYTIKDEYSYAILRYFFDNYTILKFANVDASKFSNHVAAIEALDHDVKVDAEMTFMFFKGNQNSLKVKENIISKIHDYDIDLIDGKKQNSDKILELLGEDFVKVAKNNPPEDNEKQFMDAVISLMILKPAVSEDTFDGPLPSLLYEEAEIIARSRFDVQKVKEEVKKCYREKQGDKEELNTNIISECIKSYNERLVQEIGKVITELEPYEEQLIKPNRTPEEEEFDQKKNEFYSQFEGEWINLNKGDILGEEVNIAVVKTRPGSFNSRTMLIYDKNKKSLLCFVYNLEIGDLLCSYEELNTDTVKEDDRINFVLVKETLEGDKYWIKPKKQGEELHIVGGKFEKGICSEDEACQERMLLNLKKK